MESSGRLFPALSFGTAADLYDRVRPGYPLDAVRWMLEPAGAGPLRVVDLGAGTGLLTRALLQLGHEVLPVEPDPAMRAQLVVSTPGADPLHGTAEAMPVVDASVDAVVAAQAYHWFDRDRAHPEIARVLRDGGVFALAWNDRKEDVAWLAELALIANGLAGSSGCPHSAPVTLDEWFTPIAHRAFQHSVPHTVDSLVELIMSRSYYLTASPERQARIVTGIRTLASDHPDLDHQSTFDLPYQTLTYRTTRLPR